MTLHCHVTNAKVGPGAHATQEFETARNMFLLETHTDTHTCTLSCFNAGISLELCNVAVVIGLHVVVEDLRLIS